MVLFCIFMHPLGELKVYRKVSIIHKLFTFDIVMLKTGDGLVSV